MSTRAVIQRARTVLPAPAADAARALALGWGRATARWRMRPAFVIVGAQRAGTTTLFRLLSEHPHVIRPTLSKGTGYFDDGYHHGERWYLAHFPLRRALRIHRSHPPPLTFECSGYYMHHPLAAQRMARDLPDVRVVAILRDPVERACSAYEHELARGFEALPFDIAVDLEPTRTAGERERLEQGDYRSFEHRHHCYLGRGEYADQVDRLFRAFGRDRVCVVEADAFFEDPIGEFVRLQRWLGLPVWVPEHVQRWNSRPRAPLSAPQRERLRQHFAPHDRALAELLGHRPTWNKELSR